MSNARVFHVFLGFPHGALGLTAAPGHGQVTFGKESGCGLVSSWRGGSTQFWFPPSHLGHGLLPPPGGATNLGDFVALLEPVLS